MTWSIDIIEVGVISDLPLTIYFPDADPAARLDVPCYCYLLTGGGPPMLVDTGPDRIVAARSGFTIRGDARSTLAAALSRRGLSFVDIHLVVQSHLHYDHLQNTLTFPVAQVLVPRRELEWARSENPGPLYAGIPHFVQELGDRLTVVEGDYEIGQGITRSVRGLPWSPTEDIPWAASQSWSKRIGELYVWLLTSSPWPPTLRPSLRPWTASPRAPSYAVRRSKGGR